MDSGEDSFEENKSLINEDQESNSNELKLLVKKTIELPYFKGIIFISRDQLLKVPEREDNEYLPGDLVWIKTRGFPWWPCIITIDPLTGKYSKTKVIHNKNVKVFHVQYFGSKPFRGYTENYIMVYEGKEKYELKLDSIKNTPNPNKSQRKIELANYLIKASSKKEWNIAASEADAAMNLSREERIKTLTFYYVLNKKSAVSANSSLEIDSKKESIKRKSETQSTTKKKKKEKSFLNSSTKSSPADVYDFNEFDEDFLPKFELSSAKRAKGEFSVYANKTRAHFEKEYPELSKDEITDKLQHNWNIMSEDMKNAYSPRPLFTNNTLQLESSKIPEESKPIRKRKKYNKETLEDDEDNFIKNFSSVKKKKKSENSEENLKTPVKNFKKKLYNSLNKSYNSKTKKLSTNTKENSATQLLATQQSSKTTKSNINQFLDNEENGISEDSGSLSESEQNESKETERYCGKCLQNDKYMIKCEGSCFQYYHKDCLYDSNVKKCEECFTEKHKCFICHKHSEDVAACFQKNCGKFYHLKCFGYNYPYKIINEDQKKFKCPLHFCLTCFSDHLDDNIIRTIKRKLIYCIKCPTAYHVLDSCIAAGSISVNSKYIICPEHYDKKKTKHVNVSWCFSCNYGGELICCEKCPAAFHCECLEVKPEGSYFCSDCLARKQLHYGDIVWVKLSTFRWWPGILKHPSNVPDNIMKISHTDGDFPVFFFGSHDYFWINRSRAFLFIEGDEKRNFPGGGKGLDKAYKLAMHEVVKEYALWQESKRNIVELKTNKPPSYYHLKSNRPYGKCQQALVCADKSHNQTCECTEEDPCGNDNTCLNRLLMYECDTTNCKNTEICKNHRFKKREYAKTEPFKTKAGWGLKSLEDIKKGQFVIEYVGELVDEEECNRRLKQMALQNNKNFYFLTIDKDTIIDAGPKGNLARFMNHSCDPNCETQKWVVNNQTRVGLFAKYDIPLGSELTFNYNLECRGDEKTECLCNSQNCSGFIGVRPNKLIEDNKKQKHFSVKKKKLKPHYAAIHEDECFRCGEVGKLIMCDFKACPKSYHLNCLNLEKIPHGKWNCPWHHCDECGKQSLKFCNYCPSSFCVKHSNVDLVKLSNGNSICQDHPDSFVEQIKSKTEEYISSSNEDEQVNLEEENVKSITIHRKHSTNTNDEEKKLNEEKRKKNIESREQRMRRRNCGLSENLKKINNNNESKSSSINEKIKLAENNIILNSDLNKKLTDSENEEKKNNNLIIEVSKKSNSDDEKNEKRIENDEKKKLVDTCNNEQDDLKKDINKDLNETLVNDEIKSGRTVIDSNKNQLEENHIQETTKDQLKINLDNLEKDQITFVQADQENISKNNSKNNLEIDCNNCDHKFLKISENEKKNKNNELNESNMQKIELNDSDFAKI